MAITENTTAHNTLNPNVAPVLVAVVTVPGPRNEPTIMIPGPIALILSFRVYFFGTAVSVLFIAFLLYFLFDQNEN